MIGLPMTGEVLDARFADPGRIIAEALEAFLPPERVSVADYAAKYRYLTNEGGGFVGGWSHEEAPYLVGPMEAISSRFYSTVAIVGPGQCGKTEVAQNWLMQSVDTNPANMLWYMQTDDGIEAFVKNRVNTMIDGHHRMKSRLGLRPVDDSLHFKRFRGMTVEFLSATTSNLINKSAPRIVADEVDAYPSSLGDVKAMLDVRRQTYGADSLLLAISHPDRSIGLDPAKWVAGIMAMYGDSDRRMWYWPCPVCGAWSSPCPLGSRVMSIEHPDEGSLETIEAEAFLRCPVNHCEIRDDKRGLTRRQMNREAFGTKFKGWVGQGQTIDEDGKIEGELARHGTAGFWIVGAMSPFVMGGIGGLARAKVKAEREFETAQDDGSAQTLRTVMSKSWGIPMPAPKRVGSVDAAVLAARTDPRLDLGVVPEGVRFLTLGIDCQIAHFDWLVRGWGVKGESWVVDRGRLSGDPATDPDDWDRLLAEVISRKWPLAGDPENRVMELRAAAYDSHGAPGVTQQAMEAWRRWRRAGKVRLYGKIAGREAWSIIPLRGVGSLHAPRLGVSYPDTSRRTDRKGASRGDVPVGQFNANTFKDDLAAHLMCAEPGDLYVHFPAGLLSAAAPHAWFQQLTAETRLASGRWEKPSLAARNEALDLMVINHVAAHLHGLPRLDWEKPPAWAAEWDRNPSISAPVADVSAPVAVAPHVAASAQQEPAKAAWLGDRRKGWLG